MAVVVTEIPGCNGGVAQFCAQTERETERQRDRERDRQHTLSIL